MYPDHLVGFARMGRGVAAGASWRQAAVRAAYGLAATLIGCALAALLAGPAMAATKGLRVRITFGGSGSFTAQVPAEEDVTHVVDSLSWESVFHAVLMPDGTVVPRGPGVLEEGPGTYTFDDPGTHTSCSGSLPLNPYAKQLELTAQGGTLTVESLPKYGLTAIPQGNYQGCIGYEGERQIDLAPVAAAYTAGFLNVYLPDVLSAAVPAPSLGQAVSKAVVHVTQADAPKQMPSSCPEIPEPGCALSLQWTGTVTFEAECQAKTVINCSQQQAKAAAAKAAAKYAVERHQDHFTYRANRCEGSIAHSSLGIQSGALGACAGAGIRVLYDELMTHHYRAIAKDPPDSGYRHVAPPRTHHVKGMRALQRLSGATHRLMARYLRIAGLTGAVVTAQDRASGALGALSKGHKGANRYLRRQNRAVIRYARAARRLLAGQHRLARRAAAQLRRVASRLTRRSSPQLAVGLRLLAAEITSTEASAADRLAIAGLTFKH